MNGLDFFFPSPSPTIDTSTANNGEDDDWGEFVDSSDPDRNGADLTLNRIQSEKKNQVQQWGTSRGPVPLSVFGEEEEGDESGALVSSFGFSFDSFSSKHNGGFGSVNRVVISTNPSVGISGSIANLYRENGQNEELNLPENKLGNVKMNGKIEDSSVSLENLNWNPLKLDTEISERMSNVVNSSTIGVTLEQKNSDLRFEDQNGDDDDDDDDDGDGDGWEFKAAESMFQSADGGYEEEQEKAKSGSVVVQNTTNLSSTAWSLRTTNGTGPNFDTGKIDGVESVFDRENGDDDPWDNGGWELKDAEAEEPKNDITNKESNGWAFGFGFEPDSKIETTTSFQSKFEKEPKKKENGSISFPSNGDVNEGTSWAFNQPSLEIRNEKEEKEVQTANPKGVLPLSFFDDEELGTSDTLVHEDNLVSVSDFSMKEKTKAPTPTVNINDLISSLYSQVEEKNALNLSEKSDGNGFVSVKAATDSNFVNVDDDSWDFQAPQKTITDSSIAEGADDFDSNWEFEGPSPAMKNSDVTEGVDEFDDDSWEFQGPTQPVKDSISCKRDNGSWDYKHSSVENEAGNQSSVPDGFGELHEKPVIRIEPNDYYQDVFHKLKTELYYIALNHLETLKEARDKAGDSDVVFEVQKCEGEVKDLQKWLNNDAFNSEVKLESLQTRSSSVTELYKALKEPKFQAFDSEDLLLERLLSAEKDWKSAIELLKYATLTLKILKFGSPDQQSKYASTWFVIASACAQELRHAASVWKQVIKNNVQEEILSKPRGKSYVLSVGEIYRVVKILRASIRLYKPWILLAPTSSSALAVLDECVKLWLSSGLGEALVNNFSRQGLDNDNSADQLLESMKVIDEADAFTLHSCITSAISPTCYISGLNTEIVSRIKMVEWNEEHYLLPIANLWANLISRDPPSLPGHGFPTVS